MPEITLGSLFVVAVCTRNRPWQVRETLAALREQTQPEFPVVVVDQSDDPDLWLEGLAAVDPRITVLRDTGRGLSRARNLAWRATVEDWLVFVDDDCILEPDFAEQLKAELTSHSLVDFVSVHVGPRSAHSRPDDLPFSTFSVQQRHVVSGRWVHPSRVGSGVCMAVRRSTVERLGGWDERLGPGAPDFPAADDMDFNFRLLRMGGVAYATPAVRAHHDQWRPRHEVVALYAGYTAAWAGLAVKTLRNGAPLAAAWLWLRNGPLFVAMMVVSAVRRRSRFRYRVAEASLRALVRGTRIAWRRTW